MWGGGESEGAGVMASVTVGRDDATVVTGVVTCGGRVL